MEDTVYSAGRIAMIYQLKAVAEYDVQQPVVIRPPIALVAPAGSVVRA